MPLDESKYTGGDMLAVFFGVVFGVLSLGFTVPNFKAIVDGTTAGYLAFKIIFHKPSINRDDPTSRLKNIEIGDIEFKNVSFAYREGTDNVLDCIDLKFK